MMEGSEPPSTQQGPTSSSNDKEKETKKQDGQQKKRPEALELSTNDAADTGDIADIRPAPPDDQSTTKTEAEGTGNDRVPSPSKQQEGKDEPKENGSTVPGPKPIRIRESVITPISPASGEQSVISPVSQPSSNHAIGSPTSPSATKHTRTFSEWSHQLAVPQKEGIQEEEEELQWQEMPAYASFDIYDDDDKLVAREKEDSDDESNAYAGLGGAGKGYTRVQDEEDAKSATSLDENTAYLFKDANAPADIIDDDENLRDPLEQMQANKTLLNENQRIAYVGVVRLAMADMMKQLQKVERTRAAKKNVDASTDSMTLWSQKIMVRLYGHMELDPAEQVMIEQLADHGLEADDLTSSLMQNARVKNPAIEEQVDGEAPEAEASNSESKDDPKTAGNAECEANDHKDGDVKDGDAKHDDANDRGGKDGDVKDGDEKEGGVKDGDLAPPAYAVEDSHGTTKKHPEDIQEKSSNGEKSSLGLDADDDRLPNGAISPAPPPYEEAQDGDVPEAQALSEMPTTSKIDIDLRWTALCDLFLILIADGTYDARSRFLLEQVGNFLSVSWLDIRRFEKRVTDALEMAEEADKENWNEADHMEARRKKAMKRRLMMMGLATVGGGLVIGLSAGLLAPVIGAGLAAGFTTIGITGTSGFLAGAGSAAVIGTGSAIAGGTIGVRAANRRTGAVKTFEYRPLFNNKRVNLILTVSGWMNSKVDDVRLPFSTVDPVMGDIYSILWEPDMLQSMGDTINILASEALTQILQQVLGATILTTLMAALQLPIVLSKLSYLIDNPWSVSLARADLAGLILADSIIDRNLGNRPITLIGYSLGSRLIVSCLKELANKGAYGLIHNVFLFGTPAVIKKDDYRRMRTVASGRFVNGYATNDWILGYLFRATGGGISSVAGLTKIDLPGIENVNCTEMVPGHMSYRQAMPKLLKNIGFAVTSEEFTEIEDPDPDNHEKRQRELVNEIEEARKEIAQKPEKRKWGLFKRAKLTRKNQWETYDERMTTKSTDEEVEEDPEKIINANQGTVLFDIEAIQKEVAELAAQGIEIKELESTQPALKIDSPILSNGSETSSPRRSVNLRESRSYEGDINIPHRPAVNSSKSYTNSEYDESEGKISMSFEPSQASSSRAGSHPNIYEEEPGEITMSFEPNDSASSPYEGKKKVFGSRFSNSHENSTNMTFGTDFEAPQRSLTGFSSRTGNSSPFKPSLDSPKLAPPEPTKSRTPSPKHSPSFKPPPPPPPPPQQQQPDLNPSHNVWADLEDEEFGKEKDEPELTFA